MSLINILLQLSQGMLFSILIFSVTLILSLPLGLLVAFARMSKIKAIRIPASIYISIMIFDFNLHLDFSWNAAYAATYGGVFRSVLYFRYKGR